LGLASFTSSLMVEVEEWSEHEMANNKKENKQAPVKILL